MITKEEGLVLATDGVYDVAVVGSGAAGYSAAVQAAWAGLSVVLLGGFEDGGQLMLSDRIENYPGLGEDTTGPGLADAMEQQAVSLQRSAVQLSCRSSVERVPLHGASRCPHNFPPTLLVS